MVNKCKVYGTFELNCRTSRKDIKKQSFSLLFCDRSIYLIAMFLKGAAAADEKWVCDDERG